MAHFLGKACVDHSIDPGSSAPLFIEAAEALEHFDLDMVLPDSPHAIGALCLSLAGELPAAEALLTRALAATPAGPAFDVRHRLLMAWLHLRTARYELPSREVESLAGAELTGRDELMLAAIQAGLARRSGDVPRLREAWAAAEPALQRGVGDLFHLEPISELILAAYRLRHPDRARPVLEVIDSAVESASGAIAWTVPAAWLAVQLAIENDDADGTGEAAQVFNRLSPATDAQRAIASAARLWTTVLTERVEYEPLSECADALAAAHLPWEASRLAGQAAVRVREPAMARRLLEKARMMHHSPDEPGTDAISEAGLTAREIDVGRYVVDGLTYREIGAQLYVSPKTVEHHVARIRRKLQANTRAEMGPPLAALAPLARKL